MPRDLARPSAQRHRALRRSLRPPAAALPSLAAQVRVRPPREAWFAQCRSRLTAQVGAGACRRSMSLRTPFFWRSPWKRDRAVTTSAACHVGSHRAIRRSSWVITCTRDALLLDFWEFLFRMKWQRKSGSGSLRWWRRQRVQFRVDAALARARLPCAVATACGAGGALGPPLVAGVRRACSGIGPRARAGPTALENAIDRGRSSRPLRGPKWSATSLPPLAPQAVSFW